MTLYNKKFYAQQQSGSERSAMEVVPIIINFIQPKSVIDVGCGVGNWLSVFSKLGVKDFLGVDGNWVDRQLLKIPQNNFVSHDLTKPLNLNRKFDLVISLEVAEHLPERYAETFVDSLINLGSVVLFSAAIPYQGGIPHVNEQFPDYWAELFRKRNFVFIDAIRPKIWYNDKVEYWYCQNIVLYVNQKAIDNYHRLMKEIKAPQSYPLSIVHPRAYLEHTKAVGISNLPLREIIGSLPVATSRTIKRKALRIRKQQ